MLDDETFDVSIQVSDRASAVETRFLADRAYKIRVYPLRSRVSGFDLNAYLVNADRAL